MSIVTALGVVILLGGIVVVGLLAVVGLIVLLPIASATVQRSRIERQTAEAVWRLHHEATASIGQMLERSQEDGHALDP
jgi:hypothetical protein